MNELQLMELKKSLPNGACARVAKKLGCHRNNIYQVLKGLNKNERIINELLAEASVAKNHEKEVEKILKKIVKK